MTSRCTSTPAPSPARALLAAALAAAVVTGTGGAAAASGLPSAPQSGGALQEVVVRGAGAAAAVVRAGGQVLDPLPLVGGVSARLPRGAALEPGLQVVPDRPVHVSGGAPSTAPASPASVRGTLGLGAPRGEGRGVTVAVVDTGVADVPDLAGRVEHLDVLQTGTTDRFGHGTFVAGLVAGSGASSGGRYAGVAPGARVLDVKVAADDGTTGLVPVLRGLQAVHDHGGVDVLNLSLSSDSPLPTALDPLAVALERLQREGVTVVVPSGNDPGTVSSPGSDDQLLTVGGLDQRGTDARGDDAVASWSGRGPAVDLVAPGASLVSTLAPGSAAARAQTRTDLPGGYGAGSGTSFATAVTSGAAAALLGSRDLAPAQVADLLTGTAYRGADLKDKDGAGAGGLDLAAALAARTPQAHPERPGRTLADADLPAWQAFVAAVLAGDVKAAAGSWGSLSPRARSWVASSWADVDPAARSWVARSWVGAGWTDGTWAGTGESAETWAARSWVARSWAARSWADSDWSARSWVARSWVARSWAGDWSGTDWTARSWAGDADWSARSWSARSWSARSWSALRWS